MQRTEENKIVCEKRSVSWSGLCSDLLGDIKGRLCCTDRVRFHAVCKCWRDVSPINKSDTVFKSWLKSTSILSWFVRLDRTGLSPSRLELRLFEPFHSIYEPISVQTIYLSELGIPIPYYWDDIRIFCKYSWLFISVSVGNKMYFILFSPLTKKLKQLPPCSHSPGLFFEQSMSSDPESADCVFLLLDSRHNEFIISTYCKDDIEWTVERFRKAPNFVHCKCLPMYDKGIFFIVSVLGQLATYDVDKKEIKFLCLSRDYDFDKTYPFSYASRYKLFLINGELMFNFGDKAKTCTKRYDWSNKIWIPVRQDSAIVKANKPHSSENMIEFSCSGCLISSLESSDMDQFMHSSPDFVFDPGCKYTWGRNSFFWLKPPLIV